MIKALFRKQFAELLSQFGRKSGIGANKPKRPLGVILALFAVVYLSLCVSFFSFAKMLLEWLGGVKPAYYLTIGLISTAIGLLGGVFNAYSSIYEAKDNDLLLSLPIPPSRILFVRVTALAAMSLLYESVALIPAFLVFLLYGSPTPLGGIAAFLSVIPLTLFVVAVTLVIAFLIAALIRRVKRKTVVTLIFSLLLLGLFYFLYFRAQDLATGMLSGAEVSGGVKYGLFFYYALGRASEGSLGGLGIVFGTGIALFAVVYSLLTRNFIKFTTAKRSAAKATKEGKVRAASLQLTLFKREWRLFTSSANYILNCSFGTIFLVAIAIAAIVQADRLREAVEMLRKALPHAGGTGIAGVAVMLAATMNDITAPSISMEGKRLWLLRSLPIPASKIFFAKIAVHLVVVLPPTLFASITLSVILGADLLGAIFLPIACCSAVLFAACFGLCLNVRRPILDWVDETMAVKAGMSVLLSVFGMMLLVVLLGVLYIPFALLFSDAAYLIALSVLFLGGSALLLAWLRGRGAARFSSL